MSVARWRANAVRARSRAGATACRKVSASTSNAVAAACIHSVVPSAPSGKGAASVFALGECRFDAAARITQHSLCWRELTGQAHRCARQVELDDLGRARADQKQELDFGSAFEQTSDYSIEFGVDICQAGKIAL